MSVEVALQREQSNGGIHTLLPPHGNGSPPSSPSNTPVSQRRRAKSRPKPRRKQSKPSLAPADVSTQESTTQGPGSSDSSDDASSPGDGSTPLRAGEDILESCEEEGDESRSLTPNPKDPSTMLHHKTTQNGVLSPSKPHPSCNLDHVSDIHASVPPASVAGLCSNSEENLQLESNEASDTDHHSLNVPIDRPWASRRFESDLSTAPFSSETSDLDTSGNERVLTTDSLVDVNGDVGLAQSPPLVKRVQVKGLVKEVTEPTNSGSSGDEVLSRRKHLKKPLPGSIPAKPSPPSVVKKTYPADTSQLGSGGPAPVKKTPLQHTKSNPQQNRIQPQVAGSKPRAGIANHLPTRSLSSKQNTSVRPKPPVGAKPAFKPAPPPKPQGKIGGGGGVGVAAKLPPKPTPYQSQHLGPRTTAGKPRAQSVNEDQASQINHTVALKKAQSVDISSSQGVKPLLEKKPVRAPTEERRDASELGKASGKTPGPPATTSKPSIPSKPRKPLMKSQSTVEPPKIKSITKITSSPMISDSSKNPSSSEATTSGQSQSPTNSPSPSPASIKKPLPPTKASKPSTIIKRTGPPPVAIESTVKNAQKPPAPSPPGPSPPPKEDVGTNQQISPAVSNSNTVSATSVSEISFKISANSPSPPPIPPRICGDTSSNNALAPQSDSSSATTPPLPVRGTNFATGGQPVSPSTKRSVPLSSSSESSLQSPSPRPRNRQGPRRPPPSPPCVSPPPLPPEALAKERKSEPVVSFHAAIPRRNSSPSGSSVSSAKPLTISSDLLEEAGENYFKAHHGRELVADVSYAVVKRKTAGESNEPSESAAQSAPSRVPKPSEAGQRPRKMMTSRRPPPKSPRSSTSNTYESIDDILAVRAERSHKALVAKTSFSPPPVTQESDEPPPLPNRPAPKTHPLLIKANSSSSPNLLEPAAYEGLVLVKDKDVPLAIPRTRDPIYDEIPISMKKTPNRLRRDYEEIVLPELDGGGPRLWVPPEKDKQGKDKVDGSARVPSPVVERKESIPAISLVKSDSVISRLASNAKMTNLALEDLRENWSVQGDCIVEDPLSPRIRKRQAKSFSAKPKSLMYKRNSSCRSMRLKASITESNVSVTRSRSLDRLNDRMERSVRNSIHHAVSSSEDEDEPTILSPSAPGLPVVPNNDNLYKVPRTQRKPAGPFLCPPDVEPLYQYINTAEFLREPEERSVKPSEYEEGGKKQNQLELARQLSQRKLWCELPEVISSGVLESLTSEERKLQEAIFEVISSEDSYLRSLDVLIQHFMDDPGMNPYLPEGRRVIDKRQHHVIFSNVKEVREVSARFLDRLHSRQRESAVVRNIADIILDFAENHFDCYVSYCTNQVYQMREMQDIIANPASVMFRDYLRRLESDKCCQNLNIQSFLLLPMQRITRLPLLILAILNRTPLDHPDHGLVENTLRSVQKLVTACNDGARQMDRTEQLHEIHKKLDFGKLKPFPIVSVSRQLERRGTLIRLQVEQKLLGKLKITRKPLYLFVFTDLVIITKRKKDPKGDYIYRVKDFASRAVVEVEWLDSHPGVSFPKFGEQNPIAKATYAVSTAGARHAFLMLLLDNASQKEGKYIFITQNDTDRTRWLECLMRPDQKDEEKIYQHWDCPQVQAVYDYHAQQPDELGLERGDVVKVYRKMADGWYEGERLRDSQWGWFPSNFTSEIENAHTRARNLRQTHKLSCNRSNVQYTT